MALAKTFYVFQQNCLHETVFISQFDCSIQNRATNTVAHKYIFLQWWEKL